MSQPVLQYVWHFDSDSSLFPGSKSKKQMFSVKDRDGHCLSTPLKIKGLTLRLTKRIYNLLKMEEAFEIRKRSI
jgi:hypothetical protein